MRSVRLTPVEFISFEDAKKMRKIFDTSVDDQKESSPSLFETHTHHKDGRTLADPVRSRRRYPVSKKDRNLLGFRVLRGTSL